MQSVLSIQRWWRQLLSQMIVYRLCLTLQYTLCDGATKCYQCYCDRYNPDYGWDTYSLRT